jgi:hypothetical protein
MYGLPFPFGNVGSAVPHHIEVVFLTFSFVDEAHVLVFHCQSIAKAPGQNVMESAVGVPIFLRVSSAMATP